MAETSKAGSQTSELHSSAAPVTKQGSQTSKTEEATEAEVPSSEADKPNEVSSTETEVASPKTDKPEADEQEENAEKQEEPPTVETALPSSSKEDIKKLKKTSVERISIISTPSVRSSASQQELNLNQLVAEFLPRSIDDISDEELLGIVIDLQKSISLMKIENEVFEHYVRRMDPTLMEGFNEVLEYLIKGRHTSTAKRTSTTKRHSTGSASSKTSGRRDTALTVLESGPRVTLTTKSDIVDKETALVQQSLNQFHIEMERAHADLKATEEEAGVLTQETLESINRFERMCTYSVDPVTGRIPAEKYERYMQEWLKTAESTIEKLRLHTNTMHQNIRHIKRLIRECRDLGYTIQPIDFDQMNIENRLLKETLAMKNKHLLELKHLSGNCSLVLVQHKKKLMQQESQRQALTENIETKKGKIKKVEKEHEVTLNKVQHAELKFANLREFTETHNCPGLMEYIKKIDQVNQLKQEMLKWERRHGPRNFTLETDDHRMETSSYQSEVSQQSEPSFTSRSDSDISEEYSL